MSTLTPTARVILGMLKLGVSTGYDIKKTIDFSTRFFWSASYGQIYPELKRLRKAGLVAAKHEPRGKVKRTVYSLTPKGERALHDWLTDRENVIFEIRDESLLRLFFGDLLSREEVLANLRMQQQIFEGVLQRFREIEVDARGASQTSRSATPSRPALRHRVHHLDPGLVRRSRAPARGRRAASRARGRRGRLGETWARCRLALPRSDCSRAGGRRR